MKPEQSYKTNELPKGAITSPDLSYSKFQQLFDTGKYHLYTQIDKANGEVAYIHGKHDVNSTGVFALVPK